MRLYHVAVMVMRNQPGNQQPTSHNKCYLILWFHTTSCAAADTPPSTSAQLLHQQNQQQRRDHYRFLRKACGQPPTCRATFRTRTIPSILPPPIRLRCCMPHAARALINPYRHVLSSPLAPFTPHRISGVLLGRISFLPRRRALRHQSLHTMP